MTRRTNGKLAGYTFLFYIAAGIVAMNLSPGGAGIAERFEGIADNIGTVRVAFILSLLTCFCAIVLGVTLHALTRDQDPDLALFAMACRVGEGFLGGVGMLGSLVMIWLATASGPSVPDPAGAAAIGTSLLKLRSSITLVSALFFSVGSLVFCWLFLRARSIPVWLAWLGVAASALLVPLLPAQMFGYLGGLTAWLIWMPMLVFELVFAWWLIVRGVAAPARSAVDLRPL